jgi:acetyltransferase
VHFLADIDYDRHMAFVCTVVSDQREQVVGEARYVLNPDGRSCDFGIVIADAWHKSGIAGLLMAALIEAARERGLAVIEGSVLHTNTKMIKFSRALGFAIEAVADDQTIVRVAKNL